MIWFIIGAVTAIIVVFAAAMLLFSPNLDWDDDTKD